MGPHFVFLERSLIREKRLFASFPSVCTRHQRDSHWTAIREIRYWGFSRKPNPNLVQIGQKYRVFARRLSAFYCSPRHQIAIKGLSTTHMVPGTEDGRGSINIARTRHGVVTYTFLVLFFLPLKQIHTYILKGFCRKGN